MNWKLCNFHIMLMIIGYVLFLASAVGSIVFLILKRYRWTNKVEELRKAVLSTRETQSRIYLAAGLLFVTLGLLVGTFQAKKAWGSYWNWDPKQIGSCIVWLFYFALNLASLKLPKEKQRGLIIAVFSIIGVFLMGFNYWLQFMLKTSHRF